MDVLKSMSSESKKLFMWTAVSGFLGLETPNLGRKIYSPGRWRTAGVSHLCRCRKLEWQERIRDVCHTLIIHLTPVSYVHFNYWVLIDLKGRFSNWKSYWGSKSKIKTTYSRVQQRRHWDSSTGRRKITNSKPWQIFWETTKTDQIRESKEQKPCAARQP